MTYEVVWKDEALQELASLWNENPEMRSDITAASSRIDRFLELAPLEAGESRENNDSIHFDLPLMVYFTVEIASHSVAVTTVGLFGKRKS